MKKYTLRQRGSWLRWLEIHNWHRHPLFVPVLVFLVLFIGSVAFFIGSGQKPVRATDSHNVILTNDKKRQTLPTRADTVGEFLERAGIELNDGDIVEPAADAPIDADKFRINVYRAEPVVVVDGEQKTFAYSAAATPRSVADQAGVVVYPEDDIKSEMTVNFIQEGSLGKKVIIDRAEKANLNLYGTPVEVRTHSRTVGELLEEKGVVLGDQDTVKPSLETELRDDLQIVVSRNGLRLETKEEEIPMHIEYIEDRSLSFGTSAVRQTGSPGKRLVTYQISYVNDQETERKVIQSVIAQDPVKQIVARGATVYVSPDHESIMAAAGISPSDYGYAGYIIDHENATWCPTRWQGTNSCPAYYQEKYPGAENDTSLGYGLCQSTPAIKMASAGSDWRTNPVTQMRWCAGYAISRYGSWQAAYEFKVAKGWW